jgi:hypothetical protein
MYYRYLLFFQQGTVDLGQLMKQNESIPAFCSGLSLANKDNAMISMMSLMTLYENILSSTHKAWEAELLSELYESQRYVGLIELLVLSFKDF